MGETVPEYIAFENDADVDTVLSAFDVDLEKGETLAINGESVDGKTIPEDGQVVYISPSSTGA